MHFLAAAVAPHSTMDRLQHIPTGFWIRAAIGVAGLIAVVIVLRKIAKVNKLVLGIVVCLAFTIIGFNWIYNRDEPAWATPVVQWLAGFFPSKGKSDRL